MEIVDISPALSKASGPLAALQQTLNGIDIMQYPRDLGSDAKAHSVVFTIRKVKPITWEEIKAAYNTTKDAVVAAGEQIGEGLAAGTAGEGGKGAVDVAEGIIKGVGGVASGISSVWKPTYNEKNTETKAVISLYMPDTLNFDYNAQYNEMRLLDALSTIPGVGRIASGINSVLNNQAAKVLMNRAGYVFNPQQQLLFEGIDFRPYQLAFTFTPVSKQESDVVNSIIKTLRKYTAPELVTGESGMFFKPPAVFDVDFRFAGKTNPNINKVTTSFIKSIDVNYTPNGWAAHKNGEPVQTTLTISLVETSLIDRTMIENGY